MPFAHVPPSSYHVTLANRTHYETGFDATAMTVEQAASIRALFARSHTEDVSVHLFGLLLTTGGQLVAKGYACDARLYELRDLLTAEFSWLRTNIPVTAHVKGHVCTPLDNEELSRLMTFLGRCGEHVYGRLRFQDVFTPAGRISLRGGG